MKTKPQISWLDNPAVFRVNQMKAHSDHLIFLNEKEMQEGQSSLCKSLDGMWQFQYTECLKDRPVDFYKTDYDASGFDQIHVPGHIEIAGYDTIQYINVLYPWEGKEYRRPVGSPAAEGVREDQFSGSEYSPVGSYRRTFDLPEEMKGKKISLFFEGVEQAMYLWVNGEFIGYAEDTFTPSEFDISDVVKEKDNVIAVEVYKRSCAAFLEDQDFFRFFGIFRSVKLVARPEVHLYDLWIRPTFDPASSEGSVSLQLKFEGEAGHFEAVCYDKKQSIASVQGDTQNETFTVELPFHDVVTPWCHKNPYLYRMEIKVYSQQGELLEIVPYEFGFRSIAIENKVMKLNGERLILVGVNRHEWSATKGRSIGKEEMKWDMACFKRNHINAVRTCHYPDQIPWYYMCDQEGIYMMAETNLETHGSWGKFDCLDASWNIPGSFPEWEAATLDRARTHFEVFKNHTAILFWSLGNESYAGTTLEKMHQCYKEWDPDRLVHYEGVFFATEYRNTISEIESRMYAYPEHIREYLEHDPDKPFIVCEYMHDMGNSMGGLNTYMHLLDEYEMYQGGFIWDFIDQAIQVKDPVTGRDVLRYGGDFDERPADYEFSGNGIVFANREEKPAMQEVRYYYGKYE